ncbi:MAG: thioredoxin fold domain-containing protein [Bacteroidota bacterium]|nr:thioredoxin fold domain-containing protein [Bacteroidota bacterium]MDP4229431.1 thioredoxin fold domain-containing protein [Bacteroidota bacterium]MDP4235933.1 thioredoxin fold domain-containing protein [Bacteroidota bacterium]
MKKVYALFAAILIIASTTTSFAEVHFKNITYADALKQAAKEKKIVMIDFYTDWCGWCKRLDRDTYSSDELGKYADDNVIAIKINADDKGGVGSAFSNKLGISGFPTIVFFDADGKELHRVVGYKPAPGFMQEMIKAVDKNAKS